MLLNKATNKLSTIGLHIDRTEPYCNRAKLDTGPLCNYRCSFCYYFDDLTKQTPLAVIKDRIEYLRACGIKQLDLSGGESSIRPDWFEILDLCNDFEVSTVSNGYKFRDIEFLRKSQQHGLREILFSLHGYNEESHNAMVGNKQGFKSITQAIANAHELGIIVRINCTVTETNVNHISTDFVELVKTLNPLEVNFLTLNFWGHSKATPVQYEYATSEIKKAIDGLTGVIKYINVRYTPYCYMVGYEHYVCNTYQHIYDVYDWNMAVYNQNITPDEYRADPQKALYDAAAADRVRSYNKPKDCLKCKHFFICDGVEPQVGGIVQPVEGDQTRDVLFYRRRFYED